jgi:tetratricopeptide (TPR) repeat protein
MKTIKAFGTIAICLSLAFCASSGKKPAGEDKKNPEYYYDRAQVAMRYSLLDQASEYLNQAIALDPNHVPSLNLLGLVHILSKNYGEAASVLERCVALKPDLAEALSRLAQAYEGLGREDEAEAYFRKSLAADGNGFAAFSLARILTEAKKYPEALEFVDASIRKSDKEAGAYNLKGVILNQMGRYPEAIAILRTALALSPEDVNVRVNLGIALMNSHEYAQAREAFEKALALAKDPAIRMRLEGYLKILQDAGK